MAVDNVGAQLAAESWINRVRS